MTMATMILGVQWPAVWSLPLWLWRQYVAICEAHVERAKERQQ